jgi:hypothetical protein
MTASLLDGTEFVIDPVTGEPRYAHIVAPDGQHTALELVMRARVNGTPVTAICGHTWVPDRDPKRFPICARCREIRAQLRPDQDPGEIPS